MSYTSAISLTTPILILSAMPLAHRPRHSHQIVLHFESSKSGQKASQVTPQTGSSLSSFVAVAVIHSSLRLLLPRCPVHAGGRFLLSKSLMAHSSRCSGPQLRPPLLAWISCLTGFGSVDRISAKDASGYTRCVNSIRLVPERILRTLKRRYKSRVSAEQQKRPPRLHENVFADLQVWTHFPPPFLSASTTLEKLSEAYTTGTSILSRSLAARLSS